MMKGKKILKLLKRMKRADALLSKADAIYAEVQAEMEEAASSGAVTA